MSEKKQYRFDGSLGVWLAGPVDAAPDGYYPVLENMTPEAEGLTIRPGTGEGKALDPALSPLHSARRLNDGSSGVLQSTIVVGSGNRLGRIGTDLASANIDSPALLPFSGQPLSLAIFQPRGSVKPYAYAADRDQMMKMDVSGGLRSFGLRAPSTPPAAVLAPPLTDTTIQSCNDHTEWTQGGTAAAPTDNVRIEPGGTRSINAILFDDAGTTGWACIMPTSTINTPMNDLQAGMRLTLGGISETVVVQKVFRQSRLTTMSSIIYESGTTGPCSIALSQPLEELDIDAMIAINGGTEYIRVMSVQRSPDGLTSFTTSTVGAWSFGIGFTGIQVVPSFRAYCHLNHVVGAAITSKSVEFQVTVGKGWIEAAPTLTDLSNIALATPTRPDDYVNIGIYVDKPQLVTEIKLLMDCDESVNDFSRNYFFHALRPNDLVPVTVDLQTLIDNKGTKTQRRYLGQLRAPNRREQIGALGSEDRFGVLDPQNPETPDTPPDNAGNPPDQSGQTSTGQSSWIQIRFRVSDLLSPDSGRVGPNTARGLSTIAKIRVQAVVTGTVIIRVDDWYISGGYGPDIAQIGRPRQYRYRYRDSVTGVVGNYSPALQGGVEPLRQRVLVSMPSPIATSPIQADKIDVEVYGGQLLGWYHLGSVDINPFGGTVVFADTLSDTELAFRGSISEGNTHYQPWVTTRLPISGRGAGVAGALVELHAGETIDVNTIPGTEIRIDGHEYIIARIISATKFYLTESAGFGGPGLSWEITAPAIAGTPLSGLSANDFYGYYFAWGDKYNPGRLYYSNGSDLDSTRQENFLDICSASEAIQNVLILPKGPAILFTSERVFVIEPAFVTATTGKDIFTKRQIGSVGMFSRWACCVAGDVVAFLSKDGIYATGGGDVVAITDELRAIFPHEGSAGNSFNGFDPVDMTNTTNLRLGYVDRELFFDYTAHGLPRSIVRRRSAAGNADGWRPYRYAIGANFHYAEEGDGVHSCLIGGADGKLYRLGRNQADAGATAIVGKFTTASMNLGDAVQRKYINELRLAYDSDGASVSVAPGFDSSSLVLPPQILADPAGRISKVIDVNSGQGQRARDVDLIIVTTVTVERPMFYLWQISYSARPDTSLLKADDYGLVGQGVKWVRGVWIHADTYGSTRSALLEYTKDDGSTASLVISGINHAVMDEVFYPIAGGIYLTSSRLRPTDAAEWDYAGYRLEAEPAPPSSTQPGPWMSPAGGSADLGARYVHGARIDIDTAGANVNLQVQVDQGILQTTIQAGSNMGPLNANGRAVLDISFDVPFITHLIRHIPLSNARIFNVDWVSDPEPSLAQLWQAQQTDCGVAGFKIFGDGYITVRSNANIRLDLIVDGVVKPAVFYDAVTNTALERRTFRFRMGLCKGKTIQPRVYVASGSLVSVFKKDFGIQMKPWGYEGAWQMINLLGDEHYRDGARI